MEELKLLIEMVSNLPQMALWVLAGFWAYKVIVVGSIYGLIRFITLHAYKVISSNRITNKISRLDDITIGKNTVPLLIAELKRIPLGMFIREEHVKWLAEAIDEKKEREALSKSESALKRVTTVIKD